VATRAGGLPDKVEHGVTGWLVEPGNAEALASAIRDAMDDRARLVRMGRAGRAFAESLTWSRYATQQAEVYQRVLARKSGGAST